MKIRNGRCRLLVEIPKDLYERIKKSAQNRNITFTRYVNRALMRYIIDENKFEMI